MATFEREDVELEEEEPTPAKRQKAKASTPSRSRKVSVGKSLQLMLRHNNKLELEDYLKRPVCAGIKKPTAVIKEGGKGKEAILLRAGILRADRLVMKLLARTADAMCKELSRGVMFRLHHKIMQERQSPSLSKKTKATAAAEGGNGEIVRAPKPFCPRVKARHVTEAIEDLGYNCFFMPH
jgi:hypothetical protein